MKWIRRLLSKKIEVRCVLHNSCMMKVSTFDGSYVCLLTKERGVLKPTYFNFILERYESWGL